MSKAIYQPSGKAREYSRWACNLYVGCSNDCTYCFNKRRVLGTVMGGPKATLKRCFKDEQEAYEVFLKELEKKKDAIIRDGGLLFSFTTDPFLPETAALTVRCVAEATLRRIPCSILTKCTGWTDISFTNLTMRATLWHCKDYVSIGFTLTGCDELEPGASTNSERIKAMRDLHEDGFKTFASIEPVIDFDKSFDMIRRTADFCDHYKIGLLSGDKHAYDGYEMPYRLDTFIYEVNELLSMKGKTVYWKDSVRTAIKHPITDPCCVGPDFSLFDQ